MTRLTTLLVVLPLALAAGCGDDDDDATTGGGGGGVSTPAQLEEAAAAMEEDDYDGALQILSGLGGQDAKKRVAEYRVIAARETLANAKKKSLETEPRAVLSLTRSSLRYHPTPEARAFLPRARRAQMIFHRKQRDDD